MCVCVLSSQLILSSGGVVEHTVCVSAKQYDLPINQCPGYEIKLSDGFAPVLEIWGIRSSPSFSFLPSPLLSGVVVPDKVISMDQKEIFDHLTVFKQMTCVKLNCLSYIARLETFLTVQTNEQF